METPQITAYLKTHCGWSAGVRAVLAKYNLPYAEKDIIQNPAFRWEMETKSGQPLSPCLEINGEMVADVSGEEVESYLIEHNLVQKSSAEPEVPINAPCPTEMHEQQAGAVKLKF
jgi:glutaredoxin-related protein